MSEIPLEVQMHAERLYDEGGYECVPTIIAKAILAERERCISICDAEREWGDFHPDDVTGRIRRGEGARQIQGWNCQYEDD